MIQFYNDTATIKFVENGSARNLSKSLIGLRVYGTELVINYDGQENYVKVDYTTVTVPTVASAEELRDILNGYLIQSLSTIVDTGELATFTQQYSQTEILFHILEELQEQTRILKKIYQ